jgi:hypothetical protein
VKSYLVLGTKSYLVLTEGPEKLAAVCEIKVSPPGLEPGTS